MSPRSGQFVGICTRSRDNAKRIKQVLSEETVLATAWRVEMGDATASETGVIGDIFGDGMGPAAFDCFLRKYGRCIRQQAQQSDDNDQRGTAPARDLWSVLSFQCFQVISIVV